MNSSRTSVQVKMCAVFDRETNFKLETSMKQKSSERVS